MQKLNLPVYDYRIKEVENKNYIFDSSRKKYVSLTPEEWVRQNFVSYLIKEKKFPAGRLVNEYTVELNGMKKRSDTVVFDSFGNPFVIVEYKAPSVKITQDVFDQIVRYNMVLKVTYLIVSNGLSHFCCKINYETNSYSFLREIPSYSDL